MLEPLALKRKDGFTIVELLIVIVVIAILAAISVVAYTGIQNRANDTAIQSDLRNIGSKFTEFYVTAGRLPAINSTDLGPMKLSVSKNAYGNHYTPSSSNGYNIAVCFNGTTGDFVLVAASKSGNVFAFRNGGVQTGTGPLQTINTTCANNGLSGPSSSAWLFNNGSWNASIGG